MIEETRNCKKCKKNFRLNDQNFYRSSVGNFLNKCKECYKEDQKVQRANRYYSDVEAGRERENERYHRYKKNSEARIKWTEERKESGKTLDWQRNNKDRSKIYSAKREYKNHDVTKKEWKSCKEFFDNKCAYCDIHIDQHFVRYKGRIINGDFHKEHVDHEGSIYLDNCVPSCRNCNSEKHTFKLEDWYNPKNFKFSNTRLSKIYKWINEEYEIHMEYKYNIIFTSDISI